MTIRPPLHSTLCLSMIHQLVSTLTIHLSVHTVPWAHQHGCVHNATAKLTCFLLFSNFVLSEMLVADVRLLIESHFESGVYQSIGMGPKSGRLQWLQLCFMSFILLPLDTISLPPSQSLLCKSVSGYKMQVFLWHHTFLSYLPTLECWHIAEKKTLDL